MPLSAVERSDPVHPLQLRRIARIARALVLLGAAGLAGHTIWAWSVPEHALAQMKEVTSAGIDYRVTLRSQVLGALWTLLPVSVLLLALQRLWTLFGEYEQARVFSHRALLSLRSFARCLLATAFLSPIYGGVLSIIATAGNSPGHRELTLSVSSQDFVMLLFGVVVLAISSVMAEAARVAEDHAGFV